MRTVRRLWDTSTSRRESLCKPQRTKDTLPIALATTIAMNVVRTCERQFLREQWPGYRHVTDYLNWIKPRLEAIRNGENSVNARQWYREFIRALHRRITL